MRCKPNNYFAPLQILQYEQEEINMKRTVLLTIMLLSFLYAAAVDVGAISGAFKSGNAAGLLSLMEEEIDLAIPGSSKKCKPSEAVDFMNAFFNANKPTSFSILHNAEKNESGFIVGKLLAQKKEFRVNITYHAQNGKLLIQSIRIE
jgi:hypothetical protein